MKASLLGSTALVGAMLASPAVAQLEIRVGGSVGFQAGYVDLDEGDESLDGFDFRSESEIIVYADGVADNGLYYGAKVEINTSADSSLFGEGAGLGDFFEGNGDEVSLYVGGSWGKLEFGDFDGAADEMQIYAPTVGIGQVDGDYTAFAFAQFLGLGDSLNFLKINDSGDGTKINYYTPQFAGFRFGVSYAPYSDLNPCGVGEQVCLDGIGGEGAEDIFELGLNYTGQFGDFGITASGVYVTGEANNIFGFGDIDDFAIGLQVAYGNFTVGGHYGNSFDGELDTFSFGATYELGPWGLGASFVHSEADDEDFDYTAYGAGAVYTLAPGLTIGADVVGFNADDGGDDLDGIVVLTEVKAAF